MNLLTTYRTKIETILTGLTVNNGYSFDMASTSQVFDNPWQVAEALLPRAYVFTREGDVMELERTDITTYRNYTAAVSVLVVRRVLPGQSHGQIADKVAADVVRCVSTDSYWATNSQNVLIEPVEVIYGYDQGEDWQSVDVLVTFELDITVDLTDT